LPGPNPLVCTSQNLQFSSISSSKIEEIDVFRNLVPRVFLVVARELRKTLVKYDEISKILGDLSHAQ
jgi:hypothetical protein